MFDTRTLDYVDVHTNARILDHCLDGVTTHGLYVYHPYGLSFFDWATQQQVYRRDGFFCSSAKFKTGEPYVVAASNYGRTTPLRYNAIVLLDARSVRPIDKLIRDKGFTHYSCMDKVADFTGNIVTFLQFHSSCGSPGQAVTRIDVRTGQVIKRIPIPYDQNLLCDDQNVFVYKALSHAHQQPQVYRYDTSSASFIEVT